MPILVIAVVSLLCCFIFACFFSICFLLLLYFSFPLSLLTLFRTSLSFFFLCPVHSDCNNLNQNNNNKDQINYDNQLNQNCKSCNGPLGKINLLGIFLDLQTVILIATMPYRTGKKKKKTKQIDNL